VNRLVALQVSRLTEYHAERSDGNRRSFVTHSGNIDNKRHNVDLDKKPSCPCGYQKVHNIGCVHDLRHRQECGLIEVSETSAERSEAQRRISVSTN